MAARSENVSRIEGLDHLRAFAAFLVIFHHSFWSARGVLDPPFMDWWHWWKVGPAASLFIESHIAVAIFFTASGFIFTVATYQRDFSYREYMRNRCLRVLPVYFTVLFFGIALFPDRFNLVGFLASATIFADQPHVALDMHPVSTAFWTVGVEMQFYLVFPLLVGILNRQGPSALVRMVALMLALRGLSFALSPSIRDVLYWHLIPGRLDQFLGGMLCALVYMQWKADPRVSTHAPNPLGRVLLAWLRWRPATLVAASVLWIWAWTYWLNRQGGYPVNAWWKIFVPTVEATLCGAFLLGWLAIAALLPRRLSKALDFLGDMSFSAYLLHFTIVGVVVGDAVQPKRLPGLLARIGFPPNLTTDGKAIFATLVYVMVPTLILSWLMHTSIESPIMALRRKYVRDEAKPPAT